MVLTHDVSTITKYAYDRVRAGKRMAGICEIGHTVPVALAIEEIVLIAECSLPATTVWNHVAPRPRSQIGLWSDAWLGFSSSLMIRVAKLPS